jgi:hypothetical protein
VSRRVAIGVWILSMAMILVSLVLIGLVPSERAPDGARLADVLPILPMPVSTAAIGALVGWLRPGNAIGRLLSLQGFLSALQYLTAGYAIFGSFGANPLPQANFAGWIFSWSGAMVGLLACLILFRFPDGRVTLRRAQIGSACGVSATIVLAIALALVPGTLFNLSGVENPFGLEGGEALVVALAFAAGGLFLPTMVLGVSTVYERYRRAARRERLQLKWFIAGAVFALIVSAVSLWLAPVNWGLAKVGMSVAISALPITVAIAILRQHLYDIDVVINRALVYGATSALIAVAFVAGIAVLQAILRPVTSGSEIAVAVSTLASVAIAQPVRAKVQGFVDRRFYRSRYDAARTLDAFSVRLRDEVDLDAVRAGLIDAVHHTVQPTHASVWLRGRP